MNLSTFPCILFLVSICSLVAETLALPVPLVSRFPPLRFEWDLMDGIIVRDVEPGYQSGNEEAGREEEALKRTEEDFRKGGDCRLEEGRSL